jgi:hypothetical protein
MLKVVLIDLHATKKPAPSDATAGSYSTTGLVRITMPPGSSTVPALETRAP